MMNWFLSLCSRLAYFVLGYYFLQIPSWVHVYQSPVLEAALRQSPELSTLSRLGLILGEMNFSSMSQAFAISATSTNVQAGLLWAMIAIAIVYMVSTYIRYLVFERRHKKFEHHMYDDDIQSGESNFG